MLYVDRPSPDGIATLTDIRARDGTAIFPPALSVTQNIDASRGELHPRTPHERTGDLTPKAVDDLALNCGLGARQTHSPIYFITSNRSPIHRRRDKPKAVMMATERRRAGCQGRHLRHKQDARIPDGRCLDISGGISPDASPTVQNLSGKLMIPT